MPNAESQSWTDRRTTSGARLGELADAQPVLLVFLRQNSCSFCREALDDLSKVRPQFREDGVEIVLVYHGSTARFEALLRKFAMFDCQRIYDPKRELYAEFGLSEATLSQVLSPAAMLRGLEVLMAGHKTDGIDGNYMQMPGAFVLHRNRVVLSHRYEHIASRPDYVAMLRSAREKLVAG